MGKFFERFPDPLAMLIVVVAAMIALGAFAYFVLIPKPVKDIEIQWADAIKREKARPVKYAGFQACEECHGEIHNTKKTWHHTDLSCETCHGAKGDGKGTLAAQFDPRPRTFTCAQMLDEIPDGQLFWIIQNGSPDTSMPAYRKLSDWQIWRIILYLRTLVKAN